MSLACESRNNEDEILSNISTKSQLTKNTIDDEELDYEEEVEERILNDKILDAEDGELSDAEIKNAEKADKKVDKDEGIVLSVVCVSYR